MADRIKGITVEIGGDTTGLSKALSGVNKEIRNTQSQLTDVNRLLKLDPTNSELLSQKQKLLSQAVGETKEKLTQLKSVQDQMDAGLKNGSVTQEQYDAWQREIIATEQELKRSGAAMQENRYQCLRHPETGWQQDAGGRRQNI
jgi:phage-related minor tail protein